MLINKHQPDPGWERLQKKCSSHPFLQESTLYSLTNDLIDVIKTELPSFFTPKNEHLERNLVKSASFGFFHQRALGQNSTPEQARKVKAIDASAHEMMKAEMISSEILPADITEYFQAQENVKQQIRDRQRSYCGWLIMSPEYNSDVFELRTQWEEHVTQVGRFPLGPRWFAGHHDSSFNYHSDFLSHCYELYRKWGLDRLLTWDWPVPMEPNLNIPIAFDEDEVEGAGLRLFIPWYLLRGEAFDVRKIASASSLYSAGDHLRPWLFSTKSTASKLGDIRNRHLEFLYRYYILVLKRRYADRCKGNLAGLDIALGKAMSCTSETVRKLRPQLDKLYSV